MGCIQIVQGSSSGHLPLSEPLDEGEAQKGLEKGHGVVADGRLVGSALGSLNGVAEALHAHFAADVHQLGQLPGELLELVLRGLGKIQRKMGISGGACTIGGGPWIYTNTSLCLL